MKPSLYHILLLYGSIPIIMGVFIVWQRIVKHPSTVILAGVFLSFLTHTTANFFNTQVAPVSTAVYKAMPYTLMLVVPLIMLGALLIRRLVK